MGRIHQRLVFILSMLVLAHALEIEEKPPHVENTEKSHKSSNETSLKEIGTSRKERLNPLSGLGSMLGVFGGGSGSSSGSSSSAPGGTSSSLSLQQGLQGIQNMQKLVSKLQGLMKNPFSFRGVSDTMATLTGLLAAVGGGYLTYVSMVALFGNMMDPQNTAHQYAYAAPPHQYAPSQHLNIAAQGVPAYNRRHSPSDSSGLYFGSYDIGKMLQSVTNFNYPEASFKLLRIKDEACKQRAVCEFEKYLAKKGIASVILKGVSKKISGMEKYLDAAYRGLANEDCGYAFNSCPFTLGQSLLRSIGLN